MRNRAKCKLCEETIESFHRHDFVSCKCGEISVNGGDCYFRTSAKDYANFLRVDDNGNELPVTFLVKKEQEEQQSRPQEPPQPQNVETSLPYPLNSKEELIKIVDEMLANIERLPQGAQLAPLNHYDMMNLLLLFKRFLKE